MPDDRLARYRSMRDFDRTPEPSGEDRSGDATDRPRFVVQEHRATRLHWDLRLEHEGTLVSWAIPRGLPWSPDRNNLAVHTEDHPLDYLDFSGEIPEGTYGAGSMTIWDRGTYEPIEFRDDKVVVVLHGERVHGRYALFPTKGDDWMVHRMDPPEDPSRREPPEDLRPMSPVEGALPADGAHAFELWWAGERCLVRCAGGRAEIVTAAGDDATARLPEIRRLGAAVGSTEVVFDAVVVAIDDRGAPLHDPAAVRKRFEGGPERSSRLARRAPLAALLVDVLWFEGHPVLGRRYDERRELLEGLELASPAWQTPRAHTGDGEKFLDAATGVGVRGVIAKRLDSPYRPGQVSNDWVAVRGRPPA